MKIYPIKKINISRWLEDESILFNEENEPKEQASG